jgi:hypothetical protein
VTNTTEQIVTHSVSVAVLTVLITWCLRSRGGVATATGRKVYHVHRAWYVFCALGGLFLVAIFAYASFTTIPEDRGSALACSVISALFFSFTALVFRAASVTIDDEQMTSTTLFGSQTVRFKDIEKVTLAGLVVEVRLRPVPGIKKARRLTFLAAFSGLGQLIATVRERAGLPREKNVTP